MARHLEQVFTCQRALKDDYKYRWVQGWWGLGVRIILHPMARHLEQVFTCQRALQDDYNDKMVQGPRSTVSGLGWFFNNRRF